MVKKKKVDHDKYYHLAKEHGYRSRASFKLIQLNKKFDFLGSTKCCIDLCAAPGGWLQVAQKFMPKQSLIIGVDLLPIRPIRDVFTLEEDITTAKCRGELNRLMKGMKANLVLHDGAPNVGTSWEQDAFTQSTLTLASLRLATEFLAPNGLFVTKVFRSSDYNSLLWVFKQLFTKVTVTKPPASRNTSAEIYAVCQGYLAPKEIDHRFLDPKHVFKELDTVAESQLLKGMKRASRHREGYDEDAGQSTLLFKQSSILDFLHAELPVEVLSKNYVLEWKERKSSVSPAEIEADKAMISQLWNHRKTKPDIKEGVGDIKNMSHRGIKQLLRWRLDMREALIEGPKDTKASAKAIEEPVDAEKQEEDELQTLLSKLEMRQKRKERKERKKRTKQQHRIDLKLDIPNDRFDTDAQESDQLFRLRSIESAEQLTQINKGEISGVDEMLNELSDDELDVDESDDDELDITDQERKRKRDLERTLDLQYREFMDRRKRREEEPQGLRRKKRKHAEKTLDDLYAEIDRTNTEIIEKAKEKVGSGSSSSSSSSSKKDSDKFYHGSDSEDDEDSGDEETKRLRSAERDLLIQAALMTRGSANPLIRKNKQAASSQSKLWFGNELFEGVEEEVDDDAFVAKKPKKGAKKPVASKKTAMKDVDDDDETVEDNVYSEEEDEDAEMALQTALDQGDDDDDEDNDDPAAKKYKELLAATATPTSSKDKGRNKSKAKEGDFEVVPFEEKYTVRADEDTQEIIEEIEALGDHEKAQLLAMATLVKTGRMSWSQLLDFGFNRYCFTDTADAPQWFRDNESRHNKPQLPVTKQMMDEIRREWREISTRPIKKVAEAKARKRIRSKKQLDVIKNKSNAIVADNELSEAQKRRQIERLHKKRSASEKPKVVTVVRKKFQKNKRRVGPMGKTGTKVKVVDGRMKKELRAQKRKAASKKR